MADCIIIHLSDLHVTFHLDGNGEPLKNVGSYISTNLSLTDNKTYGSQFCKFIEDEYPNTRRLLVITGDIADQGFPEEYEAARIFLQEIMGSLGIQISDVLLIPGDHDINRIDLQAAHRASDKSKPAYQMIDVKFRDFSNFYNSLLHFEFPSEKVICNHLVLEAEKLLLVGLNSNAKIGAESGSGYIDLENFVLELSQLEAKFGNYSKIAFVHHNLEGQYENKLNGQWDAENKIGVIQTFGQFNFNAVFYGNEHTPASNRSNDLLYISAAAFGKTNVTNGFRVYRIDNVNGALSLDNRRYSLINDNAKTAPSWGSWSHVSIKGANENMPEIILRAPLIPLSVPVAQDIFGASISTIAISDVSDNVEIIKQGNNGSLETVQNGKNIDRLPQLNFENSYSDKIFSIIKEEKLFLSGHFHWSDSSKAHNWINIPVFLSNLEHLQLAQKAIYEVIIRNDLKFDFILGLGIEGNILATYSALRFGTTYSYLPYSYRYQDHAVYEKNIHLENKNQFHQVLVITDVINNGKTVERLIEVERDFFKDVKIINVVSLFYTGDPAINPLNIDEKANVRNHYVTHMKVEKCPYDVDFRKTCMIYREKLDCVHEFYDSSLKLKANTGGNI